MTRSVNQVSSALEADPVVAELIEELASRLRAGEPVDVEAFLEEHPAQAEPLRRLLPTIQVLAELGRSGASGSAPPLTCDGDPASGTLGDFRLLRELGRGGMGIVYEAEQISLGRRVALKVLPFAATMDPRHLQRFHNEARAAGSLEHPHIVPVHYVGCERGIHFYAMQLIEGQSLAAVIGLLRQARGPGPVSGVGAAAAGPDASTGPYARVLAGESKGEAEASPGAAAETVAVLTTEGPADSPGYFRAVARLGVQAAEALEYAHELGVVHRDVKPANLLLDLRGNLWVNDFGLAQVQSDPRLTLTGDLVGTLRYMSPEQALGNRLLVDHRTDVYSLGVTLYEVLTLEPAFPGTNREELFRQIASEEPRPPRRINKAIPAELETIVLKAMGKNPAERYATAQELADDLGRFLEDKAIRARRPSLAQRGRKWARRHQAVVRSAALVALILAGSLGWIVRDWQGRRAAAEGRVAEALAVAERQLRQGNPHDPELVTAVGKAEAQLASGVVREGLRERVEQVLADLAMLAKLEDIRLAQAATKDNHFDVAGADPAYARAFREYGIDVEMLGITEVAARVRQRVIGVHLAVALDDWALARQKQGGANQPPPNKKGLTWKQLLQVAKAADPDPWRGRLRDGLERTDPKALEELVASGRPDDLAPATAVLLARLPLEAPEVERMVLFLRRVQQRNPNYFWLNHELGFWFHQMRPPRLEEATRYFTVAVALRPLSPGAHYNLGNALRDKGQLDEAIAAWRQALRIKKDYAEAHDSLGLALQKKGQLDQAIAAHREALRINKDYAVAHSNLGIALADKGQLDEAIAECREALRINKDYAGAHNNLGYVLLARGQLDGAIAAYREALRIQKDDAGVHSNLGNALRLKGELDEAIAECREALRINKDHAGAHNNLGIALADKGQLDEAIAAYRNALRIQKDHANAHNNLGDALRLKGELDEAIAECREALRIKKDFAEAHDSLGIALAVKGQLDEAIAAFREALRIKKDYAGAHCNLANALEQKGQFAEALVSYRRGHEIGSRNPGWRQPSAQWVRNCERLVELDAKLPAILSGQKQPADPAERLALAQLCQLPCKKHYVAATRFYREAFAEKPQLADDLRVQPRYNAACAAALAGCGQGKDADQLDPKARARLRQQALDWLRAELATWHKVLEGDRSKAAAAVRQQMQHWLQDADFAGVRGPQPLARLPEAERSAWRKLWAEVEELFVQAGGKSSGPEK
jgi:tetratricopeptide (TPR) repeat protein